MSLRPHDLPRFFVGLVLSVVLALVAFAETASAQPVEVELYGREGCPHCAHAAEYLEELGRRRRLRVQHYDVTRDRRALAELERIAEEQGISPVAVPMIVIADRVFVGFDASGTTAAAIEAHLDSVHTVSNLAGGTCDLRTNEGCDEAAEAVPDADSVRLPWLGTVRASEIGLPLFTIAIGLVDGFNPCAMWVLLFLLSMLVNLRDRFRMAVIAATFVLVSAIVYFAFMAAWLEAYLFLGLSRGVQIVLGVFAVFVATVHVKDFVAFHEGPTLSIPESAKPGIYARVRAILRAEHLGSAMVMVTALAFLVNLVELVCTAGLPALYTQVLASHELGRGEHYGYLGLYTLAYMADDSVMVTIGVVTLGRRKLQERGGRWLKLLSGVVIGLLGLLLLFAPEWLMWG